MGSYFGKEIHISIFGQSHAECIGVTIDGLPAGEAVDEEALRSFMLRRAPGRSAESTARREADEPHIICGLHNGRTCGAPLTAIIKNGDTRSKDYDKLRDLPRPGHADLTAEIKYRGFQDGRGGGHFSGRVTAGIVAAGAVCLKALERRSIFVGTHILSCGGVADEAFGPDCEAQICSLEGRPFPVLSDVAGAMEDRIAEARNCGDSLGGIIQTAVSGMPAGVGEPWFDSLEGVISRAVFAIGGIKGIEFGRGFAFGSLRGSEANDAFRMRDGRVVTLTNNSGGINGGISNGMPIVFDMAVRPTPSISIRQQSVDYVRGADAELQIRGRHDPAIVRRICPVVTCMTAVVLCDQLALRFGTDWLAP